MLGLGTLVHNAQAAIDRKVAELIGKLFVAFAFLVGAGFLTAAASIYVNRQLGPELGNLVLAAVFCAIGLMAAFVVWVRTTSESEAPAAAADTSPPPPRSGLLDFLSDADREVVKAALLRAGPIAIPAVLRPTLRLMLRNLPLIIAVALAAYVLSRQPRKAETAS